MATTKKTTLLNSKKNIQKSPEYKKLTTYLACANAEGFCDGENATEKEIISSWQFLHDTGYAYTLQGWFGRMAQLLIENEVISKTGKIL